MSGSRGLNIKKNDRNNSHKDPLWVRILLTGITLFIFVFLLIMPLVMIFAEGFSRGFLLYVKSITDADALKAIQLTFITALIVVPVNTTFGLFAAWAVTRFNFKGKTLLISLIDLPFAVSPVVAGLIFVLLFGSRSFLGGLLSEIGIKIIFAPPGIILATLFITFPFVARELIPLMQEMGKEEEEAAMLLGAGGLQMFMKVTLPNIKWGLLYGVVLCNARAIGEFGAVSVVSGHIRGKTNTLPLHIEILYNEYQLSASFAAATILVFFAFISLIVKNIVERKYREELLITEAVK